MYMHNYALHVQCTCNTLYIHNTFNDKLARLIYIYRMHSMCVCCYTLFFVPSLHLFEVHLLGPLPAHLVLVPLGDRGTQLLTLVPAHTHTHTEKEGGKGDSWLLHICMYMYDLH